MDGKIHYWITGIGLGASIFVLLGIVTDLIPNPWFVRMIPKTPFDYFFLIMNSVLLGSYIAIHFYKKSVTKICDTATYSGGITGFLAFGCPVCNKILVLLLGTTALITYFEPWRPILGIISIFLLTSAIYFKVRKT
jgi:hypothetical protein